MPVRRSPFEQLSDHRSTVSASLMPVVDDQSADPEALVCRIDAPHHEADDLISDPNSDGLPRVLAVGTHSQVVGHWRNEALLGLLHLQCRACLPVVGSDLFKSHSARSGARHFVRPLIGLG
jgi:hypothetical protein